ncbi:FAD-binding protein, partial [Escherichia coli]|uniref:FAD-binding protein n=1 Tax=Escherichia coli TaxID=562 RepID=UPI0028DF8F95
GAQFSFRTPARQLEKTGDRVTAVIVQGADGAYRRYRAKRGVILATGDIGGNEEMMAAYAPVALKPTHNAYAPKGYNNGSGHQM